ncbi:transposase, partial [Verrucomicrobium sp. 3C]|uniref:transposase n=1 Tax=Verrucomicrobium sp. 3C TaxID=1134055 RepID=UPI0003667B06
YLPLYIFADDQLLGVRLRPSNQDASAGSLTEVSRIVGQFRSRWPGVKIVLRADSGFCREEIMAWCEANQVDYLFGFARNERVCRTIESSMEQARRLRESSGKPARFFTEFAYGTLNTWS